MDEAAHKPTNPLVRARFRLDDGTTSQADLATLLGCSHNTVKWSEAGCFNVIPSCYRLFFPELTLPVNQHEYQTFRRLKRLRNFVHKTDSEEGTLYPVGFNENPPKSMKELLSDLNMTAHGFAVRACVQHAEVHRLLVNEKNTLPSNLVDFFQTIELPDQWILQFNRNINQDYERAN